MTTWKTPNVWVREGDEVISPPTKETITLSVSANLPHTEEEYLHYVQIYLLQGASIYDVNLHQQYADALGIDLLTAKKLCYKVQASIPFCREGR